MKKKTAWICLSIALLILVLMSYGFYRSIDREKIPTEFGTIEIYFCPQEQCEEKLIEKIKMSTESIHCAFYDVDESIVAAMKEMKEQGKEVKLVIDKENKEAFHQESWISFDTRTALMHDKFCIFDKKEIMTGSMNPTENDMTKNANNLIFISSKTLAKNYEAEFQSFEKNKFGYDAKIQYEELIFNNFTIENYFCPEDNCEEQIVNILNNANEFIFFMQFSFTSDVLGNILNEKSNRINVFGIFERTQISQYSEYERLQSISCLFKAGKLHHKVFIVDNEIVITGSMNPSSNGNKNNDENIVIIHNTEIAALFVKEFEKLKKDCS